MNGIHTALVTPFADDGTVDLDRFAALCTRQIDAGIHGLVVCGTTGETPTLTLEEQEALLRVAVRTADDRVPVTMGVGTNSTRTTVQRIKMAKNAGADIGLMVFPYYNKPNAKGHHVHLQAALEVGLPLMLYHVPGRTGQRLDASLLCELAAYKGVVAVKEATGDLHYGGQVLTSTDTPILSGDDFTFLPLLAMGSKGCVSVVSNVDPARTVAVYEQFIAGRMGEAREAMHHLWPLVEFLFSDSNPVPCKNAMAAMGLCSPRVRSPLAELSGPSPVTLLTRLGLA